MSEMHRRYVGAGLGLLWALLGGCSGAGSDDGGGSGGTTESGGVTGSGGASSGGTGVGGSGGTIPGEFDPEDLGTPCEAGACPSGLTPTSFEICGIASCDTVCECHLPCEGSPGSCPDGLSCQEGGFNLPADVCL